MAKKVGFFFNFKKKNSSRNRLPYFLGLKKIIFITEILIKFIYKAFFEAKVFFRKLQISQEKS